MATRGKVKEKGKGAAKTGNNMNADVKRGIAIGISMASGGATMAGKNKSKKKK